MKNKTCGIYLITERETQQPRYVGQSIDIEGRWRHHKGSRGKYPADRFDYQIVIKADPCFLDALEQLYIEQFKTHWSESGDNQTWGGQFYPRPEEPHSPVTRAKQSAAAKGKAVSEEARKNMSKSHKGKTASEDTKKKMSETRKGKPGKPLSEEAKKKLSESRKGKPGPNKGKPMSEESRKKLSESKKGKPTHMKGKSMSEEQKKKLSESAKNAMTEEMRKKISEAVKNSVTEEMRKKLSESKKGKPGKPHSEESKKKMSEYAKVREALKRAAKAAADASFEALLIPEIISVTE